SEQAVLGRVLHSFKPSLVLDVGANEGQYALFLRRMGYSGQIISYDPLSFAYEKLRAIAAPDPNWRVGPGVGCGAIDSKWVINVAGNPASSSLLPMLAAHVDAAPASAYRGTEGSKCAGSIHCLGETNSAGIPCC